MLRTSEDNTLPVPHAAVCMSRGARKSACIPQPSDDAFKVVVVGEMNYNLAGIVLLLPNIYLCSEMAAQEILKSQHMIGDTWLLATFRLFSRCCCVCPVWLGQHPATEHFPHDVFDATDG